ncbi:MAG: MFS transporter [Candidatus Limnocylindrales bacterium]
MDVLVTRARDWHHRWRAILPVLVVEFIVVLGFGALLPILPLYVTEQGVDATTLGIITGAWGLAKIVAEPVFGHIADRFPRKPMMITGMILLAIFTVLPLFFTGAAALFVLRLLSGTAAAIYDPPARAMIVDATTEGERGEAFGLYSAAQMGGLLVGPVFGAIGASLGGGFAFPFVLTAGLAVAAAVYLWVVLPSARQRREAAALAPVEPEPERAPLRALANRLLIVTVVMNLGFALSGGTYETIWSLYMRSLGASIDFIGLTFALFALPVLLFSTYAGRVIDRRHGMPFAVVGGLIVAVSGLVYSVASEPVMPAVVGLIEGTAFAFIGPALYSMATRATPVGRTATTQGIFGSSSQVGVVIGAFLAGGLWEADHRFPFWFFFAVATSSVVIGVLVARGAKPIRRATPIVAAGVVAFLLVGCDATAPPSAPPSPTLTASATPTVPATAVVAPSPTASPARTPFDYVVQPGDSLIGIADRFGLEVTQLLAANPQIADPDRIEVGATLLIPPPDAPSGLPDADAIDDPSGDLLDGQGQPAFAPGYVDISRLEARVDANTLFIELLTVSRPVLTDPDIEQIWYDIALDTTGDGQPDYQLRASNTLDLDLGYAAVVVDLATGSSSNVAAFPGTYTVGPTVRFEVFRNVLGDTRTYALAATVQRRYFIGGVGDPEVAESFDYLPAVQWPRANAQWLKVGR